MIHWACLIDISFIQIEIFCPKFLFLNVHVDRHSSWNIILKYETP